MKSAIFAAAAVGSASALETMTLIEGFGMKSSSHYGDPKNGCKSDEISITIQDVEGDVCTPKCASGDCPADVPKGVTADPQCALQDGTGSKYCALLCSASTDFASLRAGDAQCGKAKCRAIQGTGICTYDVAESLESIAAKVNAAKTTWTAESPSRFGTVEDAKALCGTFLPSHPNYEKLPPRATALEAVEDLPAEFDARTQWPKCTVISKVRDQSACGSCWAFGSTESFEDRRCIATGDDIEFSTYDTAANCKGIFACGASRGCGGGQPTSAWKWFTKTGVVSGGDSRDVTKGTSCLPYPFAACAHHVNSTTYPACPKEEYATTATSKCSEDDYATDYATDKELAKTSYSVSGIENIKTELVTHGPLSVAFTVYADFPTYKSGVYKHTSGSALGGHAVELIGYGTEDGEDYWLVKNSWNEEWGDGGFFKIAHGECGIEDTVAGGTF